MKTRLIAVSALAAVGALAAGLLPAAPVSAQEVVTDLSITKIVTGDGPQGEYPFELVCDEEDINSFGLANGETVVFDSNEVDFSFGEQCVLTETDSQGAVDIFVIVTASDGTEIPVVGGQDGDAVTFTFSTLDEVDLDYSVVVFNAFPAGDGDICPSVAALSIGLEEILNAVIAGGGLTPAELELVWVEFTNFLLDSLAIVPEDQIGAFQTSALAFVQVGNILESVGYDVTALTEEQGMAIDAIFSSAEFGISSMATYLVDACAPIDTTTTTTSAASPAATTPRFAG